MRVKMLSTYNLDATLNKEKLFLCTPPPEIDLSSLPSLPDDWLTHLTSIYQKYNSSLKENAIKRHIDEDSGYQLKSILIQQLQLIYYRLEGSLDTQCGALSEDERRALVTQLTINIDDCTEGFHNRVNIIIDSLQEARNFDELLYQVRKTLVTNLATTLTILEIHTWNRISVVAAKDGLGIKANLLEDAYPGYLLDEMIRSALQEEFQKKYTPFNLPFLLADALRGLLFGRGYTGGPKETGYSTGIGEKISALIKRYLPDTDTRNPFDWQDFFIIHYGDDPDSDICIYDLNWNLIRQKFFNVLSKGEYFIEKTPQPRNLLDCAYFSVLFSGGKALFGNETDHITTLFNKKDYLHLLGQLEIIQTKFPIYSEKLNINNFISENISMLTSYIARDLYKSDQMQKTASALRFLVKSIDSRPYSNLTLQILSEYLINYSSSILIRAAHHRKTETIKIISDILGFIIPHIVHKPTLARLILKKDMQDNNVLIITIKKRLVEATKVLLYFIQQHIEIFDSKMLEKFFLAKNKAGETVLTLANVHFEKNCLDFIVSTQKILNTQKEVADFIFKQLARLNIKDTDDKILIDKAIFNKSPLLLENFSKDYFGGYPEKLAYVTDKLLTQYLAQLEIETRGITSIITPYSLFRLAMHENLAAARELDNILKNDGYSVSVLMQLKKDYPALEKSELGKLFAACCELASLEAAANTTRCNS